MRAPHRRLVAVAIALLAVHLEGVTLPAARGCASPSPTGTVCMCCRTASGGHCPMCSRAGSGGRCPMCNRADRTSVRCGCSCQDHDAPLPSSPDVVAIMPDRTGECVDFTIDAAPPVTVRSPADLASPPPSPPH